MRTSGLSPSVRNESPEREVSVTHIWVESKPRTNVLSKPLPARIQPRSQWETWIEVSKLPRETQGVEHLARVQLAHRKRPLRSVPRQNVPSAGYVQG